MESLPNVNVFAAPGSGAFPRYYSLSVGRPQDLEYARSTSSSGCWQDFPELATVSWKGDGLGVILPDGKKASFRQRISLGSAAACKNSAKNNRVSVLWHPCRWKSTQAGDAAVVLTASVSLALYALQAGFSSVARLERDGHEGAAQASRI